MKQPPGPGSGKAVDRIQHHLAHYARDLRYAALPPEVAHAAKALVIDTLGVLVAAYPYEPCRIVRTLAAQFPCEQGATIIGSALQTTADMAAFVNATTARYAEANDVYARYRPGSMHGHPSDVIMPLLAVAEQAHSTGRAFLASVVVAYEAYLYLCDAARNGGFDPATFGCLGVAMGAGRLLELDALQMGHGIAMAIVPNNILKQVRADHLTPWKALAAGQAGRAGVFAALLARAGMPGPHLPFEGKSGWCDQVAGQRFAAEPLGGEAPFRILDARIKPRPARALTIPSILAAEKVRLPGARVSQVRRVLVEVHRQAKDGTREEHWHPDSRETADHSIPYGVAAALIDGVVTVHSFDDAHLRDARLRALMEKVEVAANETFTAAFTGLPQRYCARVTVETADGERLTGEAGGDADDLAAPKSDAQIAGKFRRMTGDALDGARSEALLARLSRLDEEADMATLPPALVIE